MSRLLLPPNRSALDAALADATEISLDTRPLRTLSDATRCPAALLPFLAWERSVENFDAAANEDVQRAMVKSSIPVHRRKGTVGAVRQAFRDLGFGEITLREGNHHYVADGTLIADGFGTAGDPDGWAEYQIRVDKLLSVEQSRAARAVLADVAPARCWLWGIDFSGASLIGNGFAIADGAYTAGVITT